MLVCGHISCSACMLYLFCLAGWVGADSPGSGLCLKQHRSSSSMLSSGLSPVMKEKDLDYYFFLFLLVVFILAGGSTVALLVVWQLQSTL